MPGDQSDTVPSDPFMMHIAPIDHYDTTAGFATPSFSGTIDGDQVRILITSCKLLSRINFKLTRNSLLQPRDAIRF